jgi:hypothetical protein
LCGRVVFSGVADLVLLFGRGVLLLDDLGELPLELLCRRLIRSHAHLEEPDGAVGLGAARLFTHAQLFTVLVHHGALEAVETGRHLLGGSAIGRLGGKGREGGVGLMSPEGILLWGNAVGRLGPRRGRGCQGAACVDGRRAEGKREGGREERE